MKPFFPMGALEGEWQMEEYSQYDGHLVRRLVIAGFDGLEVRRMRRDWKSVVPQF